MNGTSSIDATLSNKCNVIDSNMEGSRRHGQPRVQCLTTHDSRRTGNGVPLNFVSTQVAESLWYHRFLVVGDSGPRRRAEVARMGVGTLDGGRVTGGATGGGRLTGGGVGAAWGTVAVEGGLCAAVSEGDDGGTGEAVPGAGAGTVAGAGAWAGVEEGTWAGRTSTDLWRASSIRSRLHCHTWCQGSGGVDSFQ
jgi:hypothetical protein